MIIRKISSWSIIIGFIIVALIIWNRIFRYRESYGFEEIVISKTRIFLISVMVISFTILLISSIIKITKYEYKSNPDSFLNRYFEANPHVSDIIVAKSIQIMAFMDKYIIRAPKSFYEYLAPNLPIRSLVETPASYLVVWFYNDQKTKGIAILLLLLPRVIIAIIFLVEVLIYKRFDIFFKSLYLLIIPLIIECYIFICKDLAEKDIAFYDLHMEIFYHKVEGIDEPQCFARFREPYPTFEGAYDLTKVKLNTMINVYYIYANIRNFMRTIQEKKALYSPYFSLIYCPCFIIGWSYYLLCALHVI